MAEAFDRRAEKAVVRREVDGVAFTITMTPARRLN